VGLQTVATVTILAVHAPHIRTEVTDYEHLPTSVAVGLHMLYWLAWQAVLVPGGVLAAHALRSRRELVRLNAELGATEDLLAEGARSAERVRLTHEVDDALGHHLAELIVCLELAAQRAGPPRPLPCARARISAGASWPTCETSWARCARRAAVSAWTSAPRSERSWRESRGRNST
jgi:signal transduction histidine kinase